MEVLAAIRYGRADTRLTALSQLLGRPRPRSTSGVFSFPGVLCRYTQGQTLVDYWRIIMSRRIRKAERILRDLPRDADMGEFLDVGRRHG